MQRSVACYAAHKASGMHSSCRYNHPTNMASSWPIQGQISGGFQWSQHPGPTGPRPWKALCHGDVLRISSRTLGRQCVKSRLGILVWGFCQPRAERNSRDLPPKSCRNSSDLSRKSKMQTPSIGQYLHKPICGPGFGSANLEPQRFAGIRKD